MQVEPTILLGLPCLSDGHGENSSEWNIFPAGVYMVCSFRNALYVCHPDVTSLYTTEKNVYQHMQSPHVQIPVTYLL